jgi:hypothetical protein
MASALDVFFETIYQRKTDMPFGKWNIRSPCRAGSLATVARKIAKYTLHLVRVQVRWGRSGTEPAGDYTFYYGNDNHELGAEFFVRKRITSAFKWVENVSDRMYIIL